MVFSSLTFVCVFLPVTFLLYHVIPSMKCRNILLIIASLIFYAYGEPVYVLLMIVSTICNYIFGRMMETEKKKAVLAAAVIVNLSLLGVFRQASAEQCYYPAVFPLPVYPSLIFCHCCG